MGVCIVYVSVYVFLCMLMLGIGIYVLACLCVHVPGFSLLACSTASPACGSFSLALVLQPYLGYFGMDIAGSFVFRWDADYSSGAVFNVDEALLGAPSGVPWGSLVVVLLLAWSWTVFCSGDALSLRRITGRVCCFM